MNISLIIFTYKVWYGQYGPHIELVTFNTFNSSSWLLRLSSSNSCARSLPDVEIPVRPPLTSHKVQHTTVERIWAAMKWGPKSLRLKCFLRSEACPLIQFLGQAPPLTSLFMHVKHVKKVANCFDIHSTTWVDCNVVPGAKAWAISASAKLRRFGNAATWRRCRKTCRDLPGSARLKAFKYKP